MSLIVDEAHAERQLQALLYTLIAFGYADGHFDTSERKVIAERIQELVDGYLAEDGPQSNQPNPALLETITRYEKHHLYKTFEAIDASVAKLMATERGRDDPLDAFITSRLMFRCFETLVEFNPEQRLELMSLVDALIQADGVVHPGEVRMRQALVAALEARPIAPKPKDEDPFPFDVAQADLPVPAHFSHPLIDGVEHSFPKEPAAMMASIQADIALMKQAVRVLQEQRDGSWHKLKTKQNAQELQGEAPFIDCLAWCFPPEPSRQTDYIVVGDLHGCYGSLKAILAQSDFFGKVERFRANPDQNPQVKLIFLGDYLDRGFWSWEVVRTVFTLLTEYPAHVIPLLGNHEWLFERQNDIVSAVMPADAVEKWNGILPPEFFSSAKALFDSLPSVILIDRILLVHGGLPRQTTIDKWKGLENFNDTAVRLDMCWSDPVSIPVVSNDMQAVTQRFAFGMAQFTDFMDLVGARVMIRGHENVPNGFETIYDDGWYRLYTLFSAGGGKNHDLPARSAYRQTEPSFLMITERAGRYSANPIRIAWDKFNDPDSNLLQGTVPYHGGTR